MSASPGARARSSRKGATTDCAAGRWGRRRSGRSLAQPNAERERTHIVRPPTNRRSSGRPQVNALGSPLGKGRSRAAEACPRRSSRSGQRVPTGKRPDREKTMRSMGLECKSPQPGFPLGKGDGLAQGICWNAVAVGLGGGASNGSGPESLGTDGYLQYGQLRP